MSVLVILSDFLCRLPFCRWLMVSTPKHRKWLTTTALRGDMQLTKFRKRWHAEPTNVLYFWETPDGLEEVQKPLIGTLHFFSWWENDACFKFLLQHSDGKVRIWCKHESVAPSCIVSMIQAIGGLMQQKILSSPSLYQMSIIAEHLHVIVTHSVPTF